MRYVSIAILTISITFVSYSQQKEEKDVITEGKKLYRSEMASWYGTDLFLARFADKRENAGGYFSYLKDDTAICIFFSRGDVPNVIATLSFDSTYNINTAIADGEERALTKHELDLLSIRQAALNEFTTDTLFKSYKEMSPNFIPINDENGKRVYILSGPQKHGVVVFGNDYLLTFDAQNKLKAKKRLHKNILTIEYGSDDDKVVLATMHTHLPETGDLITATDICTLMLYESYAKWGQHYVLSEKNVSIWDCKRDQLVVMTREAWDRINSDQKKKR